MKLLVYLTGLSLVFFSMSACTQDENDDNSGTTPGPLFTQVKSVVSGNCATSGCHASPSNAGGLNLESNDNIVAAGSMIHLKAVEQGVMPPSAPLSTENKAKISNWINAGGKLSN